MPFYSGKRNLRNLRRRRRRARPYRRRRRYIRRRRRRGRMAYRVVRSVINPDTTYVKLRLYWSTRKVDATSSGNIGLIGNSVFDTFLDPLNNIQPAGFDQYAAMYSHYQVLGSSVKFELNQLEDTPMRVTLLPQISSTAPNVQDAPQQPYGRSINLCSKSGGGTGILKSYMSTKKMFGRTTASVNYASPVTASPTNKWYWFIMFQNVDATYPLDVGYSLTMCFYVKFWQRNTLVDSALLPGPAPAPAPLLEPSLEPIPE